MHQPLTRLSRIALLRSRFGTRIAGAVPPYLTLCPIPRLCTALQPLSRLACLTAHAAFANNLACQRHTAVLHVTSETCCNCEGLRHRHPRRCHPDGKGEVVAELAGPLPCRTGPADFRRLAYVAVGCSTSWGHWPSRAVSIWLLRPSSAAWSTQCRPPRCAAGWPLTSSSRGSIGPGFFPPPLT